MKKTLFIILIFISSLNCYSQSKVDVAFQKVKVYLMTYEVNPAPITHTYHYNKFDRTLDLDNMSIPILYVKVKYEYDDSFGHLVWFRCPEDSKCIIGSDRSEFSLGVAFKTKEQCYTFIDLLADLKDAIEK